MTTHNPEHTYPSGFVSAAFLLGLDPDDEATRHRVALWDLVPDVVAIRCIDCRRPFVIDADEPSEGRCDECYGKAVAAGAAFMERGSGVSS